MYDKIIWKPKVKLKKNIYKSEEHAKLVNINKHVIIIKQLI